MEAWKIFSLWEVGWGAACLHQEYTKRVSNTSMDGCVEKSRASITFGNGRQVMDIPSMWLSNTEHWLILSSFYSCTLGSILVCSQMQAGKHCTCTCHGRSRAYLLPSRCWWWFLIFTTVDWEKKEQFRLANPLLTLARRKKLPYHLHRRD